jgi:hypothetical protein
MKVYIFNGHINGKKGEDWRWEGIFIIGVSVDE